MFFVCFHFELCTVDYLDARPLPSFVSFAGRCAPYLASSMDVADGVDASVAARIVPRRGDAPAPPAGRAVSFQLTSSADPPSLSHRAPPMPPLPPPPPQHLSRDRTLALAFPVSSVRDAAESGASDSQPTLDPETYNVFGDARKEEDDGVPNSTRKRHRLNDREKGQSVFDSLEAIKQIRRHDRRAPRPS